MNPAKENELLQIACEAIRQIPKHRLHAKVNSADKFAMVYRPIADDAISRKVCDWLCGASSEKEFNYWAEWLNQKKEQTLAAKAVTVVYMELTYVKSRKSARRPE